MLPFHVPTRCKRVSSGKLFWTNLRKDWKYDFRSLILSKSWIFRDWARPLPDRPGWIFLAGKQSGCCCFDAWECFELILASQSVENSCLGYLGKLSLLWSILGQEDGSEAPGGVPVNLFWLENSLICFSLMFGRVEGWFLFIWDNFFLVTFHCLYVCMAIWDFRWGTLRRKYGGVRIRSEVAWIFRLGPFLLKCSHFMSQHDAKEFPPANYFEQIWEKIGSTISAL